MRRRPHRLAIEGLEPRIALSGEPVATRAEVEQLLMRASAASHSQDAIIAIVDRGGKILGVRVESGLSVPSDDYLVFAVDGAVAKARTAAFFSSDEAPLTSRTVRFISQSTVTQREVQSSPNVTDVTTRGPGFVAPIGLGGHFPPDVAHTPVVDLFAIEHTNRDSMVHPGPDGVKGTTDDIKLRGRFDIDPLYVMPGQQIAAPESYGYQSGIRPDAQSRGIATLPGGIPLYKNGTLVGGIGVFFPGADGYATYEQGFRAGVGQATLDRTNAARVLEAEWIAFAAAGGSSQANASVGALDGVARVPGYDLPFGRIDLAGITLESYGPIAGPLGVQRLLAVGKSVGIGDHTNGGRLDEPIDPALDRYAEGARVPDGWLVAPHNGAKLSAAEVTQIIMQGISAANAVRAQIRLPIGQQTEMVLAVADLDGSLLGLFRMPDATVFSIDVAVAKARNTAYYASGELQPADRVDDARNGTADLPLGTALTNRTFRFLAEPRYPSGVDGSLSGAFSILRDPGINPQTAENAGPALPASAYTSTLGFDAFNPGRNFRDPTDIANQNGVVFFPGSTPVYRNTVLSGGFGVSGDGVDQDDVVTFYGAEGFQAPAALQADEFFVRDVRLPYYKFPRNPLIGDPLAPSGVGLPPSVTPLAPFLQTTSFDVQAGGEKWFLFIPLHAGAISIAAPGSTFGLYDAAGQLGNTSTSGAARAALTYPVSAGVAYKLRIAAGAATSVQIANNVADVERLDVTRDTAVTPQDALRIINQLLVGGARATPISLSDPAVYLDTNLDGSISPRDVLEVINYLLRAAPQASPAAMLSDHTSDEAGSNDDLSAVTAAMAGVHFTLHASASDTGFVSPPTLAYERATRPLSASGGGGAGQAASLLLESRFSSRKMAVSAAPQAAPNEPFATRGRG